MKTAGRYDTRLDFRLPRELKRLIEQAASIAGQSVSQFAVPILAEAASRIVERGTLTRLSRRDRDIFLKMLDAETQPNPALRRAAKNYKERYGQGARRKLAH